MTLAERLARLDQLQRGRMFKVVASAVIALLALGGYITYALAAPEAPTVTATAPAEGPPGADQRTDEERSEDRSNFDLMKKSLDRMLVGRADTTLVGVGLCTAGLLLISSVWLGLGLTYLAFGIVAAAVIWPLLSADATRDWGRLLAGVTCLGAAFVTLMRLMSLLLSGPGPVFGIARNVLAEATRLKLSLVFITLMLFALAALPSMRDSEQQLRYRVQTFLQYGTGGTFWAIALLVVLFSVSTVATEQRGKVIWQTMTKPVAAWQYVLGKWLGVTTLALVLLASSGTGVFLFVEYLRGLPANQEVGPFQSVNAGGVTQDRMILEGQILAARVTRENEKLNLPETDPVAFAQSVEAYIAELKRTNPDFNKENDPHVRDEVINSLAESVEKDYRVIPAAPPQSGYIGSREYTFKGMGGAVSSGSPITFRYRADFGSNRPDLTYKLIFEFRGLPRLQREIALGQHHVMVLPPTIVDSNGEVVVRILNGGFTPDGYPSSNPSAISFPKDGLELSYSVGSYRVNYLRVMAVLWVKLAFLAMTGICAATFLSFSVASLVSFAVFMCAESSSFIAKSLEVYDFQERDNSIIWWKWVIMEIAQNVSWLFRIYSDLKPTTKLVDGLLLSWSELSVGVLVLSAATGALFWLASAIFKRRELAMYSGQ